MYVSSRVREHFENRLDNLIKKIDASGLVYEELGVFGSYARDDFKATSDIDVIVITDCKDVYLLSDLRTEAELVKADVVFATREVFETSNELLFKNIRRDYRRIKYYEK